MNLCDTINDSKMTAVKTVFVINYSVSRVKVLYCNGCHFSIHKFIFAPFFVEDLWFRNLQASESNRAYVTAMNTSVMFNI